MSGRTIERDGKLYVVKRAHHETDEMLNLRTTFILNKTKENSIPFKDLVSWSHVWLTKKIGNCVYSDAVESTFQKLF